MIGLVYNLEALRRGFLGGTGLSLFIIKEFGLDHLGRAHLDMLRNYVEIEGAMIDTIPDFLEWMVWPWLDHYEATKTYVAILDDLVEYQDPANCSYYWNLPAGGGIPV